MNVKKSLQFLISFKHALDFSSIAANAIINQGIIVLFKSKLLVEFNIILFRY